MDNGYNKSIILIGEVIIPLPFLLACLIVVAQILLSSMASVSSILSLLLFHMGSIKIAQKLWIVQTLELLIIIWIHANVNALPPAIATGQWSTPTLNVDVIALILHSVKNTNTLIEVLAIVNVCQDAAKKVIIKIRNHVCVYLSGGVQLIL